MKLRHRRRRTPRIPDEPVVDHCDYFPNWSALVPPLKRGTYRIVDPGTLSIHGDAPKSFIQIREYNKGERPRKQRDWPGHIAKVGYKFYPIESVTEHLITRVGQTCGLTIADSQLRMVGRQVRFLSRYFLKYGEEQLTHGLQIFQRHLDKEIVEEIATKRLERELYTFHTVVAALEDCFPHECRALAYDFVRMLAFDALIGNNDRHPMNWGVIEPISSSGCPRFSPIFDTARGLFWRVEEKRLRSMARNQNQFDAYVRKSHPQIGSDNQRDPNHFELIHEVYQAFPEFRGAIDSLIDACDIVRCCEMVEREFQGLFSALRISMVQRCLRVRHERLRQATLQGGETT